MSINTAAHDPSGPAGHLPSFAGEVARRAGGVIGGRDVAHDPSVRCADTSPRMNEGRKRGRMRLLTHITLYFFKPTSFSSQWMS